MTKPKPAKKTLVSVIMGSDSDLPVMQAACDILQYFGIAYEVDIVSAHRTLTSVFLAGFGLVIMKT